MNRILVPTDFSKIAQYGIETALGLATKMEAQIFLVNFITPVAGSNISTMGVASAETVTEETRYVMELHRTNTAKIGDIAEKLSHHGVHITTAVLVKDMQEGISDFIDEHDIDLVVMGTSGESTYTEFFIGNHTEQVIRISHCPVLAVKQSHPDMQVKNIILATDLNPDAFEGVTYIKRFASFFDVHLHILHVMPSKSTSQAEVLSKMESFAHRHHFANFSLHTTIDKDERNGILKFAKEKNADLIAVITHGRTGLSNLIAGSVSEELVKESNIPVLTTHMGNE